MNSARPLPNLRGVSGGPASWRWGDLPQTALRANKNVRCTKQGRLERERSDAQACCAGTTATPSRLPGVNGLLLHKSNLMQNVLLLCCEEPPSGRDGEQKIHLKSTKNERRKYLQENKEKLEDYFLPPSTSSFQKLRKDINCHLPGAAVTSLFGSRDLPQASPRTNQCYVGFLLQLWAEPRVTLQAHFYLIESKGMVKEKSYRDVQY